MQTRHTRPIFTQWPFSFDIMLRVEKLKFCHIVFNLVSHVIVREFDKLS